MAWSSWPSSTHNSGDLDDNEYEKLAVPYTANGVIGTPSDTAVAYGDSSGRQVKTRAGRYVLVRGHLGYSGSTDTTFSVGANTSGSTRTDLLVAGIDRGSNYNVTAYVKAGTPGSGPPATQVDIGTTGKYEIPLATIRVINGASTITAADVTPVAWFAAPYPVVCTSTTRPPHAVGLRIFETDTKNRYVSDGSTWTAEITDTGWQAFTPLAAWNMPSTGYRCYVRSRAGVAHLVCEVAAAAVIAASHDTVIANLGGTYGAGSALAHSQPVQAWANGQAALATVNSAGQLSLATFPALGAGDLVVVSGCWPIG